MDEKKEVQSQSTLPVEPTTQIQPPPIESGSKKKLVFGLLGVLLLLGIGAGVYYFINKQPTTDNSQLTTISPTVQPTIDPTAEWKTFSAPEFYTIKYPNEWYQYGAVDLPKDGSFTEYFATKPDSDNGWYDLDPDDYSISLHASPISATTYESGKTYLTMFPSGQQKVGTKMIDSKEAVELVGLPNVGGVQGIEVERSSVPGFDGGSFYIREAIFQKGKYIYLFRFFANDRQIYLSKKDTYDQILSTFKFTDSDQAPNQSSSGKAVDTSNWKSFTAEDMDFGVKTTLKLPPGYSFSFTGSEFMIQDDSNFSELWEYATSITTNGVNTYSNQSRRVWYEQYLQGQHGGAAGRDAKIISAAERSYNAISYLEAVVSVIGKNQTHYLYVQNGIFNIISPSSEAAHLPNSVIAKNIGPILQSLSVSKTR